MVHCENCGAKIKIGSKFCEGCGTRFSKQQESQNKTLKQKTELFIKIWLQVIIFANILLLFNSLAINWGYFYLTQTQINVIITFSISLLNLTFIYLYHHIKKVGLWGLISMAILSFIAYLSQTAPILTFFISFVGAVGIYISQMILSNNQE